jgi:hypothetical protein
LIFLLHANRFQHFPEVSSFSKLQSRTRSIHYHQQQILSWEGAGGGVPKKKEGKKAHVKCEKEVFDTFDKLSKKNLQFPIYAFWQTVQEKKFSLRGAIKTNLCQIHHLNFLLTAAPVPQI